MLNKKLNDSYRTMEQSEDPIDDDKPWKSLDYNKVDKDYMRRTIILGAQ
jgi:hypothetical protein